MGFVKITQAKKGNYGMNVVVVASVFVSLFVSMKSGRSSAKLIHLTTFFFFLGLRRSKGKAFVVILVLLTFNGKLLPLKALK